MKNYSLSFFAFLLIAGNCFAQQKEDPYQEKYEWRIRQEILYGVYIPKDVSEAILALNKLTDQESKTKFKNMTEEEAVSKLFFSLGRWISYNWSFHDGSRLAVNLQQMGIHNPEDMTRFIMILFHRSLNKQPLDIKDLLKMFHEKAERERNERLNKGTIIHEETRQRPKPDEGKNGGQ